MAALEAIAAGARNQILRRLIRVATETLYQELVIDAEGLRASAPRRSNALPAAPPTAIELVPER